MLFAFDALAGAGSAFARSPAPSVSRGGVVSFDAAGSSSIAMVSGSSAPTGGCCGMRAGTSGATESAATWRRPAIARADHALLFGSWGGRGDVMTEPGDGTVHRTYHSHASAASLHDAR